MRVGSTQDAAIALIQNSKGQILLVKRKDISAWVLPGGGIDPGESAEEAAIREAKEEAGVTIQISRKLAEYSPINSFSGNAHLFEGELIAGKLQQSDESSAVQFFDESALPRTLFYIHRNWIKERVPPGAPPLTRPLHESTVSRLLLEGLLHPVLMLQTFYNILKKTLNR